MKLKDNCLKYNNFELTKLIMDELVLFNNGFFYDNPNNFTEPVDIIKDCIKRNTNYLELHE